MNPVLDNSTMVLGHPREALDLPRENGGEATIDNTTARLYHSINNKLVPILAYAELGKRESRDEKVQAYCAKIHQSARDLKALIESASERPSSTQAIGEV